MLCPNCGTALPDGSAFCTECGTSLGGRAAAQRPAAASSLRFRKVGSTVPAVEFTLNRGEALYTQSGGMAWMSDGISMETNTKGGFMKGFGRMLAGESLFMATYTAEKDNATIAFASTVPGDIIALDLTGTPGLIAQKRTFLCAEPTVDVSVTFTKRFSAGLFGGEGFILEDVKGDGHAFFEIDGDQVVRELAPGETIKVSTGNVVAFDKTISYEVETVKGFKNILFGGEGLFLTRLTGPGRVILQTQNFYEFAMRINALIPKQTTSA